MKKALIFKITLIAGFILAFGMASESYAQRNRSSAGYNYNSYKSKQYYFGLTLGYSSSKYRVFRSKQFLLNNEFDRVDGVRGPGFNLAMIGNLKIGEYVDIRFNPGFAFGERNIEYVTNDDINNNYLRKFESVFVEIPLQFRYKSDAYKDMNLFLMGGIKYSYDLSSDSKSRQAATIVKISPSDFSLEVGAGFQFFFPYFIFSPELKFSHGLNNILIYDDKLTQSKILDKLFSRGFTLSLHFEG